MSTVNGFQVGSETLKYNYESLENYNTPNFSTSSSTTYAVGDYVMYNGKLYKCINATTGGTWVSGNWTQAVLSDDLNTTKNAINDIISIGEYLDLSTVEITTGSYLKSDGTIGQNESFLLSDYIELPEGVNTITVNRDVYTSIGQKYPQSIMVFWYDAEKVYQGTGTNTFSDNLLTSTHVGWFTKKYVRVNFSRYNVHNFVRFGYFYDLKYKTHLLTADLNDITEPGIYLIPTTINITNKPDIPNTLAFLTVNLSPFNGHESQVLATRYGQCTRTKVDGVWSNWSHPDDGLLYSYTGTFTTTETLQTDFTMSPNTSYVIKFYGNRTNIVNVFGIGNANNYKSVSVWVEEVLFTNDGTARKLTFYNPLGQLDSISVKVYKTDSVALKAEAVPRVYRVTKNALTGDYTSLSRCLIDLKNDHSPKVVEVWEGDYDLFAEYTELYNLGLLNIYTGSNPSMDYFDYCVWVPENTHIIGKGNVRLKWMPDPSVDDITPVQCQCISPLNVAATATIENIEVHCKNGRYCLHNDGLGKAEFTGAVQKYIGVKFFKYANDIDSVSGLSYGFNHTIGFGIDRAMHHIYDDCLFSNETNTESYYDGRAFYGHSRGSVGGVTLTEAMCSDITVKNCMLNSNCGPTGIVCKLGNSPNQNLHIPVIFNNCYLGEGWIKLSDESSGSSSPNAFDLTFNNCGTAKVNITDTSNRYPPKAYRTTMTLT